MTDPVDDILMHYGKKGMKWGVRNEEPKGEKRQRTPEEKKALAKKIAIGTGVLVAVAGATYVGYQMNKNGNLSLPKFGAKVKPKEAEKAVEKILAEPTDIIHSSRGKHKGFTFIKKANIEDPYIHFERAGLMSFGSNELRPGDIRKLPDGTIAASFNDPRGKRDAAGRVIPHQVIVPKSMSGSISSIDDVMSQIWPKLQENYDSWATAADLATGRG